jgi:hypothetical protein
MADGTKEQAESRGDSDPEVYEERWSHEAELTAVVPPTLVMNAVA